MSSEAMVNDPELDPSTNEDAAAAADGSAEGSSKKALKKAAAAAEKARQKAERAAALEAKLAELDTAVDALSHKYGDAPMVQSQEISGKVWTRVDALNASLIGKEVNLRGRIHNVRGKGKSAFIVLRQQTANVQITLFVDDVNVSKGMVKWVCALSKETVVDIKVLVVKP
jgi:lysyl-tRNA synthetase class II